MDVEKRIIKLIVGKGKIINVELLIFEEAPDDEEMVLLELILFREKIRCKGENLFSVLQDMRKELDKKNIQIVCNGSAKNVYPSPMQLSMGSGRKAYKLHIGQKARNADIVDIFECDDGLQIVSIDEQLEFYNEWVKGLSQK